jgi:hypothetical protein
MKKYYIEDSDGVELELPKELVKEVVRDYLGTTYYWSIGLLACIIGFLLGLLAS